MRIVSFGISDAFITLLLTMLDLILWPVSPIVHAINRNIIIHFFIVWEYWVVNCIM